MTGRMEFLLGTREQLEPVWEAFGIAPQREGREHSAYTVVVDGEGRQRIGFPASQLTPEPARARPRAPVGGQTPYALAGVSRRWASVSCAASSRSCAAR